MVRPVQRTARSTPALVDPPTTLLRVERFESPLRYSQISAETAALDHAGNRFDVPGAGVLYAASTAQGAFAETTAHFRHSASLLERMARAGASADELAVPTLDRSWRAGRVLRMLRMLDALPFFDIEASGSHTYLTEHARSVLLGLGVPMLGDLRRHSSRSARRAAHHDRRSGPCRCRETSRHSLEMSGARTPRIHCAARQRAGRYARLPTVHAKVRSAPFTTWSPTARAL